MLAEFSALESRDPRQFERALRVIRHLLRQQFFHLEDRGGASLMESLLRPDLEKLVANYFEVAGYRLVVREAEGWAGILPDTEQVGLTRLRIDDTLALLLLRRLWEEGIQAGDIERHGSVLVTLNEAYDAYQDMVARARRPALSAGEFKGILEGLARKAVVRLDAYDDELQDYRLTIRALVATVAGDDVVERLEQLLSRPEYAEAENGEQQVETSA
ncbi:DUF4194 domain-containing protein [Xanthobacter aminoxidans]|uniref:DUF4194 domain-containing protein n=1 Tax=Xanthobacter aminoxidans TaxID=186280 RepID=UPI003728F947